MRRRRTDRLLSTSEERELLAVGRPHKQSVGLLCARGQRNHLRGAGRIDEVKPRSLEPVDPCDPPSVRRPRDRTLEALVHRPAGREGVRVGAVGVGLHHGDPATRLPHADRPDERDRAAVGRPGRRRVVDATVDVPEVTLIVGVGDRLYSLGGHVDDPDRPDRDELSLEPVSARLRERDLRPVRGPGQLSRRTAELKVAHDRPPARTDIEDLHLHGEADSNGLERDPGQTRPVRGPGEVEPAPNARARAKNAPMIEVVRVREDQLRLRRRRALSMAEKPLVNHLRPVGGPDGAGFGGAGRSGEVHDPARRRVVREQILVLEPVEPGRLRGAVLEDDRTVRSHPGRRLRATQSERHEQTQRDGGRADDRADHKGRRPATASRRRPGHPVADLLPLVGNRDVLDAVQSFVEIRHGRAPSTALAGGPGRPGWTPTAGAVDPMIAAVSFVEYPA